LLLLLLLLLLRERDLEDLIGLCVQPLGFCLNLYRYTHTAAYGPGSIGFAAYHRSGIQIPATVWP
jgi:hypothetical protein